MSLDSAASAVSASYTLEQKPHLPSGSSWNSFFVNLLGLSAQSRQRRRVQPVASRRERARRKKHAGGAGAGAQAAVDGFCMMAYELVSFLMS